MNAIVYHTFGTPAVLKLTEVATPTPKDGEVLIRIHASSINSWDWDLLRGKPFLARLGGVFKPQYNILGADISGKIEAIGKDVKQFKAGDEVFGDISGCGWGGFAEYVCVPESALVLKSSRMTFEQAAAIPQAAVLALQGLRDSGKIQKGHKVLINGAGGGVGTFAMQLAKVFGASVTVVDSAHKLDMLRALGADHAIDYTQEDFTRNGQSYDLILDVVGNRSLSDYKRALSPTGLYVMVGGTAGLIFGLLLFGGKKMKILIHKPNQQDLNFITSLFDAGKIKPVIDRCCSLHEVPDALQYFGTGKALGKVIIRNKE